MTDSATVPRKLWEHSDPESTHMAKFRRIVEIKKKIDLPDYVSLYEWSVKNRAEFWEEAWNYFPIIHEGSYAFVVDESARIDSNPAWFPGVRLNFAENVLFTRSSSDGQHSTFGKDNSKVAVVENREDDKEPAVRLTWGELRQKTGRMLQAMKAAGIQKRDRIAIVGANSITTLLVFLASTALGAIFSSASTDTGINGILDRLLQIKPKFVFVDDFAVYNGRKIDLRQKMRDISRALNDFGEFHGIISIPRFANCAADIREIPKTQALAEFLERASSDSLEFVRIGFRDPFVIVFSSGTTGQPKCIVHSVGGVVLSMWKESQLHRDMHTESILLQYTTPGWIMYLTSVCALMLGATSVLYDGSPFLPRKTRLLELATKNRVTQLGISPRWLNELRKHKITPREVFDLATLRTVISTGMVLQDTLFEWFYDKAFLPHTSLANISGGTDLAACFALDNPLSPLYMGGCQGPSLGVPIAVYEQAEEGLTGIQGIHAKDGEPGELVATAAFPSMPIGFWGDMSGEKYRDAYFARYENVWTHGDFISIHPITKQVLFLGRSDGVLNPSGVRFGSAEIYNVLETRFSKEVIDALCVGQRRPQDVDESVLLFLMLRPGLKLDKQLSTRIKEAIKASLSARHVPKYIFETPEIPVTINLKKVELPVKQIVSGKRIKPSDTLLNPKSLDFYYQFAEVEKLIGGLSML